MFPCLYDVNSTVNIYCLYVFPVCMMSMVFVISLVFVVSIISMVSMMSLLPSISVISTVYFVNVSTFSISMVYTAPSVSMVHIEP
jgi:hypothetical protein